MKKQYDQVKLHATVMNSKLRNTDEQTPAKKSRSDVPPRDVKKLSFDARNIISVRLHPGGGGVPIMVYRPVLAPPKRGTFFKAFDLWKGRDFASWSIWKGGKIYPFGL